MTAILETDQTTRPVVLATLWVPMLPAPPGGANRVAAERHRAWLWNVATFRDHARSSGRFGRLAVPFRVLAAVRIADQRRHQPIGDESLARWRTAVERAVARTLTGDPSLLRAVEVSYEPLDGIPLEDQPRRTGTHLTFTEEDQP